MRFSDIHLRTIFTSNISSINHENYLENYLSESLFSSIRNQWVNQTLPNSVDFKDIYPGYNWYYAGEVFTLMSRDLRSPTRCLCYIQPPSLPSKYSELSIFYRSLGWLKIQINSYSPSATYMRQWTGSALVQIMACRLIGAKPLPEPILT